MKTVHNGLVLDLGQVIHVDHVSVSPIKLHDTATKVSETTGLEICQNGHRINGDSQIWYVLKCENSQKKIVDSFF